MTVKFTNNASTTVATGINTTATSLVVTSAAGFPTLSGSGDYCYLTIQQAAGTVREVVKATALSTNTFTIVRAQDGTSAGSWSVSDVVELRVTAALLTDILDDATHDSSVLSVDSTNNRVGVNDTTPSVTLDISGTDAIALPVGTTAQRPSGSAGRFRYNSSLSQFEGYTDAWGAIGGGGTNTFTTDTFTANGSLVAFNLSQTVSSESNLLVFIDGVFQTQDAYAIATASGTTTLTFSAAPANARKIVVYSVAAGISGANLNIDSMTGDGSDVTLTLSLAPVTEQNTQVFIDGVYQNKSTYSTSGTTLTFSTAPPTGSAVEVVTMTQTEINVPVDNTITSAKLSGALTTPAALTVTGALVGTSAAFTDVVSVSNANARLRLFETDTTDLNTQIQSQGGDFKISTLTDDASSATLRLLIDHATGNTGIGTGTTVNRKLEVAGNNNGGAKANYIRITDTDTSATANNQAGGIEFFTNDVTAGIAASMEVLYAGSGGGGEITFNSNASSSGTLTEAMRIDESGKVGISNSSPSSYFSNASNLVVGGTTGANGMTISGSTDTQIFFADGTSGSDAYRGIIRYSHVDNGFSFWTDATERMRIDAKGNVGIKVTPEEDWNSAFVGVLRVGTSAAFTTSGGDNARVMSNVYYDGSNYKRIVSGYAHQYDQTGGTHRWSVASSGSAGSNATFAEAMRIDELGRVTTPSQPYFYAYSTDTNVNYSNGGKLNFNTLYQERGGSNYSTSLKRFTAPVAGVYSFTCYVYGNSSTESHAFGFHVNSNLRVRGQVRDGSGDGYAPAAMIVKLDVGDYVDVRAVGVGVTNFYGGNSLTYSQFSGCLIG